MKTRLSNTNDYGGRTILMTMEEAEVFLFYEDVFLFYRNKYFYSTVN